MIVVVVGFRVVANVRGKIMNEAEMRGLNVDELRGETFWHPAHWAVMREHFGRVREFELRASMSEYELAGERARAEALAASVVDEVLVKRKRAESRRKASETRKQRAEYVFTEEQLEIARRSMSG